MRTSKSVKTMTSPLLRSPCGTISSEQTGTTESHLVHKSVFMSNTLKYLSLCFYSAVVAEMGTRTLTDIMDDIVYKMSSSSNPVIGRAAVKTLVLIMDHSSSIHQLIHRRYRGSVALFRSQSIFKF